MDTFNIEDFGGVAGLVPGSAYGFYSRYGLVGVNITATGLAVRFLEEDPGVEARGNLGLSERPDFGEFTVAVKAGEVHRHALASFCTPEDVALALGVHDRLAPRYAAYLVDLYAQDALPEGLRPPRGELHYAANLPALAALYSQFVQWMLAPARNAKQRRYVMAVLSMDKLARV